MSSSLWTSPSVLSVGFAGRSSCAIFLFMPSIASAHALSSDLLAWMRRSVSSTMSSSLWTSPRVLSVGFAGRPSFWSRSSTPSSSALSLCMFSESFFIDSFLLATSLSIWSASARMCTRSFIRTAISARRDSASASLSARSSRARYSRARSRSRESTSFPTASRSARCASSLANLPVSSSFLPLICVRSVSALSAAVL